MPGNVVQPFNQDVEKHGGYQYALPDRPSAVYANRRFSDVIIQSAGLDGKRIVDVGCGDGTFTSVLLNETRASSVLGIDPADVAIERARRTYAESCPRMQFRSCLARDLIAEGQQFDVAVYRGVIHHVADPAREISEALQLAPSVFLLEPNGHNPVLKLLEKFSRYHIEHQEQSFGLRQYRRWIETSGGQIARSQYFGLVPMFSPRWMVALGSRLEPVVERIPLVRAVVCGQVGILAKRSN